MIGDFSERNLLVPDSIQLVEQLIPGAGVTVTPTSGTGIVTVTATGSGGVASVGAGAGIIIGGTPTNPTIVNNGVRTLTPILGGGITLGGSVNNPTIEVSGTRNVVGGTGITVTGTNTQTVTNDGVTQAIGGSGITVSAATGNVTITNDGVRQAVAGTGIGVSGATGNVTFTNTGVTSAVAGTGISVSAGTGAVTINNTGVTQVVAGTGISLSPAGGTGAVTVNNTGIQSLNVGAGLTNTGTATNPFILNSGILSQGYGTGITNTGSPTSPVITNSGVTRIIAGAGVNISPGGGTGDVTINATGTGTVLPSPVLYALVNAGVRADGGSPLVMGPNQWGSIGSITFANVTNGGIPFSNCRAIRLRIYGNQTNLAGQPCFQFAYSGGGANRNLEYYLTSTDCAVGVSPTPLNVVNFMWNDPQTFMWDPVNPNSPFSSVSPGPAPLDTIMRINTCIVYPHITPTLWFSVYWDSQASGGLIGYNQGITTIYFELSPII